MNEQTLSPTVKSAMRTIDIIEYVVSCRRPLVAQEIAQALSIPVSSLSYLLATLTERGYLQREGRRYSPGPGLARLQGPAPAFSLAERAAPLVRSLRVQLNETSSFFVRKGWEMEALVTETSDHALRYAVQTGRRTPLHCFSAGKALLAAMSDEEFERYLEESRREALTPTTITDADALRQEIRLVRQTGVARTREESTPGIYGLAYVARADGEVAGAFSVAVPVVRFDEELDRRVVSALTRTAALFDIT
ncbi:IclR family transcriptional regulator [Sphingobium sp. Cam5-1]|uniref:IclR family transcriptional regulator n=1 Tax=Sphingobium sp. Cam5-1 TaxID=2789327 RepID=UPI0018AD2B00|nr:IclR family transcriptional regulator [Sphingobium sp. Cam5-1]QPI74589.1 IclR family transcriptional regulator [Sphingobium sp. Cam5-1]